MADYSKYAGLFQAMENPPPPAELSTFGKIIDPFLYPLYGTAGTYRALENQFLGS